MIRSFIAVEVAADVRENLHRCQQRMKDSGARGSWNVPANMHLTLRFLGDVPDGTPEVLGLILDDVAARFGPFDLRCEGLGTFGSPRRPSVLWAGCVGADGRLERLQEAVEQAVVESGFPAERRRYHPHITLARIRRPADAGRLTSEVDSLRSSAFGTFRADELVLFRSDLSAQGPTHTPLHRSGLKGA